MKLYPFDHPDDNADSTAETEDNNEDVDDMETEMAIIDSMYIYQQSKSLN